MNKIFVKSAMSKNNRTYMNLFLFIAIFCLVYFCFACDKKEDKAENQKRTEKFASKWLENLAKPDQEIVALLAIKYNKKLGVIEKILDIYLTDTDYVYRQIKSTIKKKDKEETKKPNEINLELFALDKSAYADTVAKSQISFLLSQLLLPQFLLIIKHGRQQNPGQVLNDVHRKFKMDRSLTTGSTGPAGSMAIFSPDVYRRRAGYPARYL